MVGFMPLELPRLNIPIKSGTAAKVVPNPATIPNHGERHADDCQADPGQHGMH
jgi:hypothetical protein